MVHHFGLRCQKSQFFTYTNASTPIFFLVCCDCELWLISPAIVATEWQKYSINISRRIKAKKKQENTETSERERETNKKQSRLNHRTTRFCFHFLNNISRWSDLKRFVIDSYVAIRLNTIKKKTTNARLNSFKQRIFICFSLSLSFSCFNWVEGVFVVLDQVCY